MGMFIYNGDLAAEFDDRLLCHLQVVMTAKLRRDEAFMFSWTKPEELGGGRTTVWIDRRLSLAFDYVDSAMPMINRAWLEELTATTFNASGLQVVPEPAAQAVARSVRLVRQNA